MWPVIPPRDAAAIALTMFGLVMMSVLVIQPLWWKSGPVRGFVAILFGAVVAGVTVWKVGVRHERFDLVLAGAGVTYVVILVFAPAAVALPVGALLDRLAVRVTRAPVAHEGRRVSRRGLLRAGAASLPALAAVTGASGFASAQQAPRMPIVRLAYQGLHPDLEGFRILHLSDLHLGACLGLTDLERALDAAIAAQRPDLIVLTGDLADDPTLIRGALDLVARAGARHGALASLGNHEYLHDIAVTRPEFEASAVPLLVSAGQTVQVGQAKLFVGGADDPVHLAGDIEGRLGPSIARAAEGSGPSDFRLLLCHRPEGFGPAIAHGFDLTLSGHTHGGQLGLFGRSLFERLYPDTGWWGTYERARPGRGPARLYTTSGFGHWFPFRLGCPTEMPVLVLEGSNPSGRPRSV